MALEKYTTTVVGAYSLPRWYETLEKQVEARALSIEDMKMRSGVARRPRSLTKK